MAFFLDVLHERAADPALAHAIELIGRLGAAESVPQLLEACTWYGPRPEIADALAAIGKPGLPFLRQAIRGSTPHAPADSTAEFAASICAARALGRIGDAEGARLLLEALPRSTSSDQVEAFAEALGRMRVPEAAAPIFSKLVDVAASYRVWRSRPSSSVPDYLSMRDAMVALGDAAVGFLRREASENGPLSRRALATGILFEIEHPGEAAGAYRAWGETVIAERPYDRSAADAGGEPDALALGREDFWRDWLPGALLPDAIPRELLIERAFVFLDLSCLLGLARFRNDRLAFDVLADAALEEGRDERERSRLVLALAATGDERTVEAYRRMVAECRQSHASRPSLLGAIVEGVILVRRPEGATILEEIAALAATAEPESVPGGKEICRAAGELAKAVLPALEGGPDALARLLESESRPIRETAARTLARWGDLRALPTLVAAAAATASDEHAAFREAIVGLGARALVPLRELATRTADWRERLLCEAIALRISRPDLAVRFERASRVRHRGFFRILGPQVGTYQEAGKALADSVGEEAIPLLEAAIRAIESGAPELRAPALEVLADCDDTRVVPAALRFLSKDAGGNAARKALEVLTRRLGLGAVDIIVRRLTDSEAPAEREGPAWALGELCDWRALAEALSAAAVPLAGALGDPIRSVQAAAATALAKISRAHLRGDDARAAIQALACWVGDQRAPPPEVLACLVESGDRDAAAGLLAAYRAGGRSNSAIATALGKLRCAEALEDLSLALAERIQKGGSMNSWMAEMRALGELGEAGLRVVDQTFRTASSLEARVAAARVLGAHRYREAYPAVLALFEEMLASGVEDARLKAPRGEARRNELRSHLLSLLDTLKSLDPRRAYAALCLALLRSEDATLRDVLARELARLKESDPSLETIDVLDPAVR